MQLHVIMSRALAKLRRKRVLALTETVPNDGSRVYKGFNVLATRKSHKEEAVLNNLTKLESGRASVTRCSFRRLRRFL